MDKQQESVLVLAVIGAIAALGILAGSFALSGFVTYEPAKEGASLQVSHELTSTGLVVKALSYGLADRIVIFVNDKAMKTCRNTNFCAYEAIYEPGTALEYYAEAHYGQERVETSPDSGTYWVNI